MCAPFFRLKHSVKARMFILPILFFAPLYNAPRFLELETTTIRFRVCNNYTGKQIG